MVRSLPQRDTRAGLDGPLTDVREGEQYIENSPVFQLDRVTTPLLLVHGTADTSCPVEQSWEMFQGLRRLGKEAVLVEYPGAGHTLDDTPEIARDYKQRCWDWFDKYLKPMPAAAARLPGQRAPERGGVPIRS